MTIEEAERLLAEAKAARDANYTGFSIEHIRGFELLLSLPSAEDVRLLFEVSDERVEDVIRELEGEL